MIIDFERVYRVGEIFPYEKCLACQESTPEWYETGMLLGLRCKECWRFALRFARLKDPSKSIKLHAVDFNKFTFYHHDNMIKSLIPEYLPSGQSQGCFKLCKPRPISLNELLDLHNKVALIT